MKKIIYITSMALFGFFLSAQSQTQVKVTLLDGTVIPYQLTNEGVEILDNLVKISSDIGPVGFSFDGIKSLIFEAGTSGTETMEALGIRLWTSPGTLHIATPQAEDIHIYNLSGTLIKTIKDAKGLTSLNLLQGAYVVQINRESAKITVK